MKKFLCFLAVLILSNQLFGQEVEYYRVKKRNKLVTLTPYQNGNIIMLRVSGLFDSAKKLEYLDTLNSYKVNIPKWLYLMETNDITMFGGILPEIKGIENAITISSIYKKNYESFEKFKEFIIEDSTYKKGSSPKWSDNHIINSIERVVLDTNDSYKVDFNFKSKNYIAQYVLIETKKSYLWINFAATKETFDINHNKFLEFIDNLELLN